MNIHFDNRELYCDLIASTVSSVTVGSHMYGLNNENSDVDYLHIYVEPTLNEMSFMWEHHQLQFKQSGIDHNFTTLQSFIRNALTGDATINFETLFSDELRDSKLKWLWKHRESFINYNVIKSYLGMAKRDLKFYRKETGGLRKHTPETNKKLSHFVRGVTFAKMLLKGKFVVDMKDTHSFKEFVSDIELLKGIKSGIHGMHADIVEYFEREMDELRDELNKRLDNQKIVKFMEPSIMKQIDYELMMFTKNQHTDVDKLDYGDIFYETLENGIVY